MLQLPGTIMYSGINYDANNQKANWAEETLHRRMKLALLITMGSWASCQIRKTVGCACAGNAGNVFPCRRLQRKLLVSDPDMHHGTCVTHVPWCMSGSLTRGVGENVPGIPGACAPAILCIWQEAHWTEMKKIYMYCLCKQLIALTRVLFFLYLRIKH